MEDCVKKLSDDEGEQKYLLEIRNEQLDGDATAIKKYGDELQNINKTSPQNFQNFLDCNKNILTSAQSRGICP